MKKTRDEAYTARYPEYHKFKRGGSGLCSVCGQREADSKWHDEKSKAKASDEELTSVTIAGHKGNVPNKEYKIPPPPAKKAKDVKPVGDADDQAKLHALVQRIREGRVDLVRLGLSSAQAHALAEKIMRGDVDMSVLADKLRGKGLDVHPVGDLQPTVLKLAERKPRPRSLSILEPKDMEKMTGVPGGKMTFAEKRVKDVRPVGDELWMPNHKNPVPTGWLRLSKEAMRLAGEAQLAAAKYDKNWAANKAMFSALRRLNAAQNTGDEAKLRKEAATVMSEVAAKDKDKDIRPVGDAEKLAPGDKVWANPIGKSGGTIKGTISRIGTGGNVFIDGPDGEKEFHPANVRRSSDVKPVGDAGGTYDVSYSLNGPMKFQVTASQFHEWARKNGVELSNFKSVLDGLRKFTGDPRIKDWEMDASVGDSMAGATKAKDVRPVGDVRGSWKTVPHTAAYYGYGVYGDPKAPIPDDDFNTYEYETGGEWLGSVRWNGKGRYEAQVMYILGTRPDSQPRRSSKAKSFGSVAAAKAHVEANAAATGTPHLYPKGTKHQFTKAKDVRPVGDMDGGSDYEIAQRILKLAKAGQSAEKIVKKLKGDEHDLRFVCRVMQGAYGANAEKLKYED